MIFLILCGCKFWFHIYSKYHHFFFFLLFQVEWLCAQRAVLNCDYIRNFTVYCIPQTPIIKIKSVNIFFFTLLQEKKNILSETFYYYKRESDKNACESF